MNCTFCNAPKFKTTTLKLTSGKTQKTHFCEECFDEMQASNDRWAAKKDQERLVRPAMGLTEISRRVQK